MATKLSIINKALNYLGNPSVNTLDISDEVVAAMSNLYDTEKKDMLASGYWSFAKKWALLVKSPNTPDDPRWSYEYYIPVDYITAYQVYPICNYEILSENRLYCNQSSSFKMQYIYNVDEGQFPEYFTKLMAYTLAAEAALLLTENEQRAQFWSERMISQKAIAMNRDFTAQPSPTIVDQTIWNEHWT